MLSDKSSVQLRTRVYNNWKVINGLKLHYAMKTATELLLLQLMG